MENTSTKHISKLDVDQPSGSDAISEADDHLRFIKDCIKQTFSGITAAGSGNVTAAAEDEEEEGRRRRRTVSYTHLTLPTNREV